MGKQNEVKVEEIKVEEQAKEQPTPTAMEAVPEKKKGFWKSLGTGMKILVTGAVVIFVGGVAYVLKSVLGGNDSEETTEETPEVSEPAEE